MPTTRALPRCRPSATANSQPIAGFRPWKAPSPASAAQFQALLTPVAEAAAGAASAGARAQG